jgi:esterase/lipase superfamily enzyme
MLFITNRRLTLTNTSPSYQMVLNNPALDPDPQPGDMVTMDPNDNRMTQSVHYCETTSNDNEFRVIGSEVLLSCLKNKVTTAANLLLYIHGFNNLPREVLARAEKLQQMCDQQAGNTAENKVAVIPIIWPCESTSPFIKKYWDDEDTAQMSGQQSFSRLLARFMEWRGAQEQKETPCYKRINILSHSMGNAVLMYTLGQWARSKGGIPQLFRNIFMMAADIPNEALEDGEPGEAIPDAARNVVVYYAGDDMAMTASKVANVKNGQFTRRLGHTGPEHMEKTPNNVYALDCDVFNNQADASKGHAYFLLSDEDHYPTPAFMHMFTTMTHPAGHVAMPAGSNGRRGVLQ